MIKMVIWDQSKPLSLYLKSKNQKFKNQKFVNCAFIIHKNGNKTSIQPILELNSTSFMLRVKKLSTGGGGPGGMGEPSKFLLGSLILVFTWICKYITWISKQ